MTRPDCQPANRLGLRTQEPKPGNPESVHAIEKVGSQ
jgi:hypothetical protein